jgi:hypothetical protein
MGKRLGQRYANFKETVTRDYRIIIRSPGGEVVGGLAEGEAVREGGGCSRLLPPQPQPPQLQNIC